MSKRKFDQMNDEDEKLKPLKNSLDSDEEDDEKDEEAYNVMNEDDFEGTEEGPAAPETDVGFTAFNMKEELEEGHFDKDGHYLWKKEKQIRDNWLDNIDWVKVKTDTSGSNTKSEKKESFGLADSDDEDPDLMFNPTELYKKIFQFLNPGETVSKAICRLGKGKKKLTTAERWKKKKQANTEVEDPNADKIVKLTEFANELLTRTGNMDIYQETYEQIKKKIEDGEKHSHPLKQEAELDMYADDFDTKEKAKLDETESIAGSSSQNQEQENKTEEVTWELKWSQDEKSEIHGPHTSQQMHAWAREGYFKNGAWVRRTGQQSQFYSAARIDFELYL